MAMRSWRRDCGDAFRETWLRRCVQGDVVAAMRSGEVIAPLIVGVNIYFLLLHLLRSCLVYAGALVQFFICGRDE
jgi:hypothetical protein